MKNLLYLSFVILGFIVGIISLSNEFLIAFFLCLLVIIIGLKGYDENSVQESKDWINKILKIEDFANHNKTPFANPLFWIFISILLTLITIFLSSNIKTSFFVLLGWFLSILALFAAGLMWDKPKYKSVIQIFSISKLKEKKRDFWVELVGITLLTILAFLLRSIDITNLPKMFHGDEGEIGVLARYALTGSHDIPPFGTSWLSMPNISFYTRAISLAIFGDSVFGLRIFSALLGTFTVPLIYLTGKLAWSKLAGLVSAYLMAISHFHIQYSRIAVNNIETFFFMTLFLFSIVILWKKENEKIAHKNCGDKQSSLFQKNYVSLYILVGFTVGFSQYYYIGSKLIPVMAVIYFVYLWATKKTPFSKVFISFLVAVITFAPQGYYTFKEPGTLLGRFDGVSILSQENVKHTLGPNASLPKDLGILVNHQFEKNFNFFISTGDISSFYFPDNPAFDVFTKFLFWLGLGIALTRLRSFPEFLSFTLFFVGIIFAGLITNDSPNGPRLLIIAPSVFLLAGMTFDETIKIINSIMKNKKILLPILIIPFLGIATYINFNNYFIRYKLLSFGTNYYMAREFSKHKNTDNIYLMGKPYIYAGHGTFKFILGEDLLHDMNDPQDYKQLDLNDKGLFVIAVNENLEKLEEFMYENPGGIFHVYSENTIPNVFYSYALNPP